MPVTRSAERAASATALMLALTFSTGVVDAVGYLGLDRVFTGNMTGNVVILAMALTGADGLPVLGPVLALLGFAAGAAVGGRVLRGAGAGWSAATTQILIGVGICLAAVTVALGLPGLDEPRRLVVTTLLGAAMGAQAAAARHLGVKDVTTVVVTSTITALAADSVFGSGTGSHWRRRGTAVALIMLGALAGALLLRLHLAAGPALAALVTFVVTWSGHRGRVRPPEPVRTA
ncbi:MAG: DUF1275 family protein [Micropruina sp.]|uniref:DUF1275 family protein n=1 Tax=Micropruina sp. TaxID=2737536 RepID=UPI0039E5890E